MNKSRKMRWVVYVARMVKLKNAHKILVGKHEEKRPLERPRRRWQYNIQIDHREIGLEGVDSIHLAQGSYRWRAFVNTVMNLWDT
jgi:hypothetical protein